MESKDYVKNRYFKDNDRIYILLDINQFPARDQCLAFLWGVYDQALCFVFFNAVVDWALSRKSVIDV